MLADHGAWVARLDRPAGPRWQHASNAILQRGKRSMVLDLRGSVDVERARSLAASADVLIENFRPGVMDRLGLGASVLIRHNPQLIYCSIPGFANDDPRSQTRADDGVIGAAAGLYASRDATADEDPVFNTLPLSAVARDACVSRKHGRRKVPAANHVEGSVQPNDYSVPAIAGSTPQPKRSTS
jgi:crotonobetainyl-CoA:carnitine CoA-transferase CaiB-like acyl-CoA transferase